MSSLVMLVSGVVLLAVSWSANDRRRGWALPLGGWALGCVSFASGLAGLLT
jgi:hypothetical protein